MYVVDENVVDVVLEDCGLVDGWEVAACEDVEKGGFAACTVASAKMSVLPGGLAICVSCAGFKPQRTVTPAYAGLSLSHHRAASFTPAPALRLTVL